MCSLLSSLSLSCLLPLVLIFDFNPFCFVASFGIVGEIGVPVARRRPVKKDVHDRFLLNVHDIRNGYRNGLRNVSIKNMIGDSSNDSNNYPKLDNDDPKIVLLGGAGRIGTAVATQLLSRHTALPPRTRLLLVGRRNVEKGQEAVRESLRDAGVPPLNDMTVEYVSVSDVWSDGDDNHNFNDREDCNDSSNHDHELVQLFRNALAVINTAGPYHQRRPVPLQCAIRCGVPVYVDVSDPLPYLEASLSLTEEAEEAGTLALVAAGAFPGLSNLLALEAWSHLESYLESYLKSYHESHLESRSVSQKQAWIEHVGFNYFTAGLGGSGDVNLYITNLGFGDDMPQYSDGCMRYFRNLTGRLLGTVDFFMDTAAANGQGSNMQMRERVGTRNVFSWPFPEAVTVPANLAPSSSLPFRGSSHAAMGTAPELWNIMLDALVRLVPRQWWAHPPFSQFMADFSKSLVLATDAYMRFMSTDGVGETHAMRIDVVAMVQETLIENSEENRSDALNDFNENLKNQSENDRMSKSARGTASDSLNGGKKVTCSIVQGHESFRRCVGQSCAEFCIDLLQRQFPSNVMEDKNTSDKNAVLSVGDGGGGGGGGVFLVEQLYQDLSSRQKMIDILTNTPGTIGYSGPVVNTSDMLENISPSQLRSMVARAEYRNGNEHPLRRRT